MSTPSKVQPLTPEQSALAGQWFRWSQQFALSWATGLKLAHHADAARSAAALGLMRAAGTWKPDGGSSFKTWAVLHMRSALNKMRAEEGGAVRRRVYRQIDDESLDVAALHRDGRTGSQTRKDLLTSSGVDASVELACDIALRGGVLLEGLPDALAVRIRSKRAKQCAKAFMLRAQGFKLSAIGEELGVCRERARQYVDAGEIAFAQYAAEVRGETPKWNPVNTVSLTDVARRGAAVGWELRRSAEREKVREEAVARYIAGETSSAVGLRMGVSNVTVLSWVRQAGHTIRPVGGVRRRKAA